MNGDTIKRLFPNASRSVLEANGCLRDTEPKCNQTPALGRTAPRKEEGTERITVRFTGFRVRPLDPDNFAGSVKDLLDGLRHACLIPGDEPWRIKLETGQEKVGSYKDQKTEIEIIG